MPTYNYLTDIGHTYWGVSLSVFETIQSSTPYDTNAIIPSVLKNNVISTPALCQLPRGVKPRTLKALLNDVDSISIEFPFKGGTTEYIQFIEEIESNSLIKAYEIIPEQIRDDKLRILAAK